MSVVNDYLPDTVAATVTATTLAIVFAPLAAAFVLGALVGRCCLGGGKNPPPPKSMVLLKRARESVVWAWNRVRSFWYTAQHTVHTAQHTAHTPQQLAARPIANNEPSRLNPAADIFYNNKVPAIVRTLPNLQIRADPPRC